MPIVTVGMDKQAVCLALIVPIGTVGIDKQAVC